jgi:predicted CopG family antitoxin
MKFIQVTEDVHKHLMKLRRYPIKAVNTVIERLLEAHHSEQWKRDLRVFCLEYEYTSPNDDKVGVKVMHSLGKDLDEAQSNLSRSNFDNGKYDLIKSYPIDILYCGGAFAITPIEQIR